MVRPVRLIHSFGTPITQPKIPPSRSVARAGAINQHAGSGINIQRTGRTGDFSISRQLIRIWIVLIKDDVSINYLSLSPPPSRDRNRAVAVHLSYLQRKKEIDVSARGKFAGRGGQILIVT